jgi:mevalonate kinase
MATHLNKQYHSKLLLFGEYGVLAGSPALSVPFPKFSGKLDLPDKMPLKGTLAERSNSILRNLRNYILNSCKSELVEYQFQFDEFEHDLEKGLHFKSNIPNGYGVGSSGALTAAIFDNYSTWSRQDNSLTEIKMILGAIESFFHHKSSGLDPLTSLIDHPILISENGQVSVIESAIMPVDSAIYLIDSGKKGKTGDYVSNFLQQTQFPEFRNRVIEPYIYHIRMCIENLLNYNPTSFFENLKLLSEHQYKHFPELIPTRISKLWKSGLDNDSFYLKLCGSGGGGFALAFLRDKEFNITEYLNRESLESIPFTT